MYHAIYERNLFNIEHHLQIEASNRTKEIEKLKKSADKGAFSCPHCGTSLIVKAGEIRGVFFSHTSGDTCLLNEASETYKNQVKRETKKHSVIREIVHEVLKNQEKIRPELQVEYGYIAKAKEQWSHFPDLVLKNRETELAISILTNVDRSSDNKLAKKIKKRNHYYKEKGLQTIWFIEEQELSFDYNNHVIHLWESEIDLAIKTPEDSIWDELLQELSGGVTSSIFNAFDYWSQNKNVLLDTRSLYYVYSTDEGIDFSVHRFVIDETKFPFRAFALSPGYRMNISTALSFNEQLSLSDTSQESSDRQAFKEAYHTLTKKHEANTDHLHEASEPADNKPTRIIQHAPAYQPPVGSKRMSYEELRIQLRDRLGMTQKEQMTLWNYYVLKRGIKQFDEIWLLAEQLDTFEQLEEALQEYLA